jgi:GT2 family glycosyltransferase
VRLAVVIVAHDEGDGLRATLDELGRQRRDGDEVVVVHNSSAAPGAEATASLAAAHPAVDRVIETGANLGFPRAANRGAAETGAETIVFLNPDAVPEPGCLDALRDPPPGWDAWMGLVALEDGRRVNTAGGELHYLGFGWAGRYGEPVESVASEPHEVGFLSGACLAVRRAAWDAVGPFPELFFLYVDDVDLSLRLRLEGRAFGIVPAARVRHGYEFARRPDKLRELERNRVLAVLRCYPRSLLVPLLPALIALEPVMLAIAAAQGWGGAKLRAIGGVARVLPRALRERRAIQRRACVPAAEVARWMGHRLESPFFGGVGRSRAVNALLGAYWAPVSRALRARVASPRPNESD